MPVSTKLMQLDTYKLIDSTADHHVGGKSIHDVVSA